MNTIGVTMSVYNGAATLHQALASIAAQTRPPDTVLLVDDGSSDLTAEVASSWMQVLPLQLVRHERNLGLDAGRTTGVRHCDTDLILSLDADDVWLPDHLALLERRFEERPGIVSPRAVCWRPDGFAPIAWTRPAQPLPARQDLSQLLVMNWLFSGSLFRREALRGVGDTYRFGGCSDWDLWIRLMVAGEPSSTLAEPTVLYRLHKNNMSADDRLLQTEIEVLTAFLDEGAKPDVTRAARRGLRHRRARVALRAGYAHAEHGRPLSARRSALGTPTGPLPVKARGLALLVAPGTTVRRRNARGDR